MAFLRDMFGGQQKKRERILADIRRKLFDSGTDLFEIDKACATAKQPMREWVGKLKLAGDGIRSVVDMTRYGQMIAELESALVDVPRMVFAIGLEYGSLPQSSEPDFVMHEINPLVDIVKQPLIEPMSKLMAFWRNFSGDMQGSEKLIEEGGVRMSNMLTDCYVMGVKVIRKARTS